MVKKRLGLMLVLAFGIISICACDNVENIVSDAKEQMEEDAMFTTGQTVEENIDDLVDMMDGENTDSSNTEVVETGSDKKHAIGETVSLVTDGAEDTGEKIDVTFTEWGSTYDEMFGSLTYVRYEIQNTGTESVTVGNSMFSVYADDYNVEQLYYKDDAISLTDISAGRKINGTIYMELNPDTVNTIEIECGDVIWVVKEPTPIVGIDAVPETICKNSELIPYEKLAGEYSGIRENYATISIYSSVEDECIGNISIDGRITGQIVQVDVNVYQIITSDGSVVLFGVYTDNENIGLDVFSNGEHADFLVMTSPFIS